MNQRPKLDRQEVVNRYNQAAHHLAERSGALPAPVANWVKRFPQIALGIALAAGLIVLVMALNPMGRWIAWIVFASTFYFATWFAILMWRRRQGPVPTWVLVLSLGILLFISFIPFLPHLILAFLGRDDPNQPVVRDGSRTRRGHQPNVRRGAEITSAEQLVKTLAERQEQEPNPVYPQLEIGGVPLPNSLETLGFFCVGSPGSGKTQAIKRLLATLKERPDFRAIILDRNGELLESFYDESHDLIFNPSDTRSLSWSHRAEGMEPETIAASLVPDDSKERFFSEAAKSLLADLYERCESNAEIWEVISTFKMEELSDFLRGGVSARYFETERTGASVISTLVNSMRFYRRLPDPATFSFSRWGREDDGRWLFLPIFEDTAERYKSLYSMAFELMLKGLLSNAERSLKTALVIDELGALNHLPSLARLLAESRKYGGTAILGTQTEAQIDKVYGENDRRILLQGTATKLILNCRDGKTAEQMAEVLGKQERIELTYSKQLGPLSGLRPPTKSEQIRETYAVMPAELQALPSLEGYLAIADGTPPARVRVEPQTYPVQAERLILAHFS